MKIQELMTIEKPGRTLYRTYDAQIGFLHAQGKTSEEAAQTVVQLVKAALSGEYTPRTIVFKGWFAVIYRTPQHGDAWEYTVQKVVDGAKTHAAYAVIGTLEETERVCRRHFASYLSDELAIEEACQVILHEQDREEWLAWNTSVQARG